MIIYLIKLNSMKIKFNKLNYTLSTKKIQMCYL